MKSRRPKTQSPRILRKKQKRRIILFVLLLFIIVDGLWIMNHDFFKIKKIIVKGNETLLDTDIITSIDYNLKTKILWLIPRDNILFLSTNRVERLVRNTFPRIYFSQAKIKDGSELLVEIEERSPHSLWCKNLTEEVNNINEECYFADQKGYVYSQAPYFSEGFYRKIYTTPELLSIGNELMNQEDFDNFFSFTEQLEKNYHARISRIFIDNEGVVYLYLSRFLNQLYETPPVILYREGHDQYEKILMQMNILSGDPVFKENITSKPYSLERIDFRIPEQIRYTFKPQKENEDNSKDKKNT